MKGMLIRVGIDSSYGQWNAPCDSQSNEFVYVPIPESHPQMLGLETTYDPTEHALRDFCGNRHLDLERDLKFPSNLRGTATHLDPDFENLTYGDSGSKARQLEVLGPGDFMAFYSALRDAHKTSGQLVYALIGLYFINEIDLLENVEKSLWSKNAHTRRKSHNKRDVVLFAVPNTSGRLRKYVPIGEFRNRAYRVRNDLLELWGDLTVKDGFIQRSAVPPRFKSPSAFLDWFDSLGVGLIQENNPKSSSTSREPTRKPVYADPARTEAGPRKGTTKSTRKSKVQSTKTAKPNSESADVFIVLLRQPKISDPEERRSDPFWEFGSFGCTGCHRRSLLHPNNAHRIAGSRLAFAQGGQDPIADQCFKLVLLTPPIENLIHGSTVECKWSETKPFKFVSAPLIVDNTGRSDFPRLKSMLSEVNRSTWCGKFGSKFRSNSKPLPADIASEVATDFDQAYARASGAQLAGSYIDTLPFPPPNIDHDRLRTFRTLQQDLGITPPV